MTGSIEATRGCPYICKFCPESNTPDGNKFYKRPIVDVINEIKSIPQKTIMFYDLSLTIDPDYTKNLFLKMKNLKKKFFCNGNLDILANDEELVKISKEAGCIGWLVGFESFSQKTIEDVGKKTNIVELYYKAVKNLHDNKIAVIGDFMFGFDHDTKNVFNDTLKKIDELEEFAMHSNVMRKLGTMIYSSSAYGHISRKIDEFRDLKLIEQIKQKPAVIFSDR